MESGDCEAFIRFAAEVGMEQTEHILETICDVMCGGKSEIVHIHDKHQHNACNHTSAGTVTHQGRFYGFVCHNGDMNGTVIAEWGLDESFTYEPVSPTRYMFVPQNDYLKEEKPHLYRVYLMWKKEAWFTEKLKAYHYDRHFAPGVATEDHYKQWAAKKGLKIEVDESELD